MSFRGIGIDGMDAAPPPLSRQSSIYSLTFDEFQSTKVGIGKDFGSMNMDEFLKNIWTAEETQAMASALGGGQIGLERQGSLTLPRTLNQKTVDEVWRDLTPESAGGGGGSELQKQQLQRTLGEMTLEEFLVRAGVVRKEINQSVVNNSVFYGDSSGNNNSGLALRFSQAGRSNVSPQGMRGPVINDGMMSGVVGLGGGGGVNVVASVSPAKQIASDGFAKGNGDLSSLSPVPYLFNGGLRGKKCSGAVEKVVERRQRRMIKNRESAARSRARKQAYTMELEAEVVKFKEQNQELQKKQAMIMDNNNKP